MTSNNKESLTTVLEKYSHLFGTNNIDGAKSLAADATVIFKNNSIGFGFHSATGCYVMVFLLPGVLPAFIARFDQSGKKWDLSRTCPGLLYDNAAVSVLLSLLLNQFASEKHDEETTVNVWDENIKFGGDANAEIETIRRILVEQVLHSNHPSSQFLLPLATSMAKTLDTWREHLKNRPELPVVKPPVIEVKSKQKETVIPDDHFFSQVLSMRERQAEKAVAFIQQSLDDIQSMFQQISNDNKLTIGFSIGQKAIQARVALSHLQNEHRNEWRDGKDMNEIQDHVLEAWDEYEVREIDPDCSVYNVLESRDGNEDDAEMKEACTTPTTEEEELKNEYEACARLLKAWIASDVALHDILSSIMRHVEENLQSTNRESADGPCLDAAKKQLEEWIEQDKVLNASNVLAFYKLYSSSEESCDESNDEYDYMADNWDDETQKAAMSCCWVQRDDSGALDVLFDHETLSSILQQSLQDLTRTEKWNMDRFPIERECGEDKRVAVWRYHMGDKLSSCRAMIDTLMDSGDVENAARVLVVCGRLLCSTSTAVEVAKWAKQFSDHYEYECSCKDLTHELLSEEIKLFDEVAARIALSFYEVPSSISDDLGSQCQVPPMSMWFFLWFVNRSLSFPTTTDNMWEGSGSFSPYPREKKPQWFVFYNHVTNIFLSNGWKNPELQKAMAGDETAIRNWRRRESPMVLRARLDKLADTPERNEIAVSIARMLSGDPKALLYLVSNGHFEMALAQASSSGDSKGLETLATEVLHSDPCTSFLCAQARLLHAVEAGDNENGSGNGVERRLSDDAKDAIEFLTAKFVCGGKERIDKREDSPRETLPSLETLCKMSLVGSFATAAGSTPAMQTLFEKYQEVIQSEPQLLGIAALAVIANETSSRGLRTAAEKAGFISFEDYSCTLTLSDSDDGNDYFLLKCGALYQSAMIILNKVIPSIRKGDSTDAPHGDVFGLAETLDDASFCFAGSLVSAVQLAVCLRNVGPFERLANAVRGIRVNDDYRREVLDALESCFLTAHESSSARASYPQLLVCLLEMYFDFQRIGRSTALSRFNSDHPNFSQFWSVVAYIELRVDNEAASQAAQNVAKNASVDEVAWTIENLCDRGDSIVASDRYSYRNFPMKEYAESQSRRKENNDEKWHSLVEEFTLQCLQVWIENGASVSSDVLAQVLKVSSLAHSEIRRAEGDDFQSRYLERISLPPIENRIFNGSNPAVAIRALHALDGACAGNVRYDMGETGEINPHFIFLCGFAWIRMIFGSGIVAVDEAIDFEDVKSSCLLKGRDCSEWREALMEGFRTTYDYITRKDRCSFDNNGTAAFAAATILEHYATQVLPRTRCLLRDCCHEALSLCSSLQFYLSPDIDRYRQALSLWKPRTMPVEYDPFCLLEQTLKVDWFSPGKGTEGDDSINRNGDKSSRRPPNDSKPPVVPLLPERVELAVSQHLFEDARSLCLKATNEGNVWSESEMPRTELFDLAHACLLLLKSAHKEQVFDEEFTAITLQAVLSVNWLQICGGGSTNSSSHYAKIACTRLPAIDNANMLLECAEAWKTGPSLSTALTKCVATVLSIGHCMRFWNEAGLTRTSPRCNECSKYLNDPDEDSRYRSRNPCDCAARAKKRQKLMVSTSPQALPDKEAIVKHLDELVALSTELQLPEAKAWYGAARRRLKRTS